MVRIRAKKERPIARKTKIRWRLFVLSWIATMASDGNTSGGGDTSAVVSFANDLNPGERSTLELELRAFVVRHASHHRPLALVTSGGPVADLEVNSVRCLDNFSTGL
jgi:hypothetical protein